MKPANHSRRVLAVETAAGVVMLLAIGFLSREDVLASWEAPVAVLVAIVGFITWWEVARWHRVFLAGRATENAGNTLDLHQFNRARTTQPQARLTACTTGLRAANAAVAKPAGTTTLILRGTKRWVTGVTGQHRSVTGL